MKINIIYLFIPITLLICIVLYLTIDNYKLNQSNIFYKGQVGGVVETIDNTLVDILDLEKKISNCKDPKQLELLLSQWDGMQSVAQNHLYTVSTVIPVDLFPKFMPFHNKLLTYLRDYGDATSVKERNDIGQNIKVEIQNYRKFIDSIFIYLDIEGELEKKIKVTG